MSDSKQPSFDPDLIELHLGRLSAEAEADLHRRLAADPVLAAEHDRLQTVFASLDTWATPTAPADLTERICATVAATPTTRRLRPHDELTAESEVRGNGPVLLRLGTLREIIAAAAMIVLAVGLGVPGLLNVRERSQRIACSAQLASIGQGLQQYAASFNNSLPFAGWSGNASWAPTYDADVEVLPNRRHLFRLVSEDFVGPQRFVCPSQMHVPMLAEQVAVSNDFLEARNVSYAYQNMSGLRPRVSDHPRLPVLSDENPYFADGLPLYDLVRRELRGSVNSPAHGRKGQNVLSIDGRVRWSTSPAVGIDGDNIWTLQQVDEYTGREGPRQVSDAHMLK